MSDEQKAPLMDLVEIYNDSVAEADAKGFADRYLAVAEALIQAMENEGFHVENKEYLDGYFIFGKGTNSILHFGLKECPGWSFGIWWEEPKEGDFGVSGEWFAQFTEIIDKFKPSASTISCHIYASEQSVIDYELLDNLKFIRDEPYLAFCRDYLSWNLNTEYHTREEAKQEYDEYVTRRDLKAKCQAQYDQTCYEEMVKTIKMNLDPGDKLYMCDCGECVSPRYQFIVYNSAVEESYDCPFSELEVGGKECMDRLDRLEHEMRDTNDVYIDTWTYDNFIRVTNLNPSTRYPDCKKID